MTGFCKMKKSFGQVSVEYLIIMGFVAVMMVPLIIIYYKFTSESKDEIISSQLNQIAAKVADAADAVYFLGTPSQSTIRAYIPGNVDNATLNNREVYFRVKSSSGYYDIVQVTSVNLSGELPTKQGTYDIMIKAQEDFVEISYK